jgi:hypothetical protein
MTQGFVLASCLHRTGDRQQQVLKHVSVRAESIDTSARSRNIAPAEHISLESTPDVIDTPLRHPHRRTVASRKFASALHGIETELSLLEDHYLAVRSQKSGADLRKYTLDLRFANPRPVIVRRIAWITLAISVVLLLGTVASFWWAGSAADGWLHPGVLLGCVGMVASAACVWRFLLRTTESLQFMSVHGSATLVSVTGRIGSAKTGQDFFVEIIRSISAAKTARAQAKPQFLRDEMREHHRLRELRILTEQEYESCKARILASHT